MSSFNVLTLLNWKGCCKSSCEFSRMLPSAVALSLLLSSPSPLSSLFLSFPIQKTGSCLWECSVSSRARMTSGGYLRPLARSRSAPSCEGLMGPVRVRAHTPPTLSSPTSVCLGTPVFRLRVWRLPLFPRFAVFRSMPNPPHCLRSTRLLWITHLPFSYSVSFTTSYVSCSHLFLIVLQLRHLLPPICFPLLFCNSFSCVQPLPVLPFLSFIPPPLPHLNFFRYLFIMTAPLTLASCSANTSRSSPSVPPPSSCYLKSGGM